MKKVIFHQLRIIAVSLLFLITANAQTEVGADQVITIQTEVTQIAVSTNLKYQGLRWSLSENGNQIKDYAFDAPDTNPLGLVILVLRTEPESKIFREKAKVINLKFKSLSKDLNLVNAPMVVSYKSPMEDEYLKYPSNWNVQNTDSIDAAINQSITVLQKTANARRALLIISDAKDSLPTDILKRTDFKLLKQSALIFYLGVAVGKDAKNKKRIVALSNLPGNKMTVFGEDYVKYLFNFFTQVANTMYVLSYQSENDYFKIEALCYDERNEIVGRNSRTIQTSSNLTAGKNQ